MGFTFLHLSECNFCQGRLLSIGFDFQDGQSRTIRQFQFTDWPEQGVPKSGEGFIDFIGQVHKTKEQFGQEGPITVHCRYRKLNHSSLSDVSTNIKQVPVKCFNSIGFLTCVFVMYLLCQLLGVRNQGYSYCFLKNMLLNVVVAVRASAGPECSSR